MHTLIRKHDIKIALLIFGLTLATFYVNYALIFKAPLTPTNHFGFFLYSTLFALVIYIYAHFKLSIGFLIFGFGWLFAMVQLYIDLLKARIETGGTVGAALGLIFTMMLVLVLSIAGEAIRQLVRYVLKKS